MNILTFLEKVLKYVTILKTILNFMNGEEKMCEACGCDTSKIFDKKTLELLGNFHEKLSALAERAFHNRKHFEEHKIFAINLISAPGAGKTTLLEKTIELLKKEGHHLGIITGYLETIRNVEKFKKHGIPIYQISTKSPFINSFLVHEAIHHLPLKEIELLFIENTEELVYLENHDIGAHLNIVLFSVTEGEDRPKKYPLIFKCSDVILITKIDLLSILNFNLDKVIKEIKEINPKAYVIALSAKNGKGLEEWVKFLKKFLPNKS